MPKIRGAEFFPISINIRLNRQGGADFAGLEVIAIADVAGLQTCQTLLQGVISGQQMGHDSRHHRFRGAGSPVIAFQRNTKAEFGYGASETEVMHAATEAHLELEAL